MCGRGMELHPLQDAPGLGWLKGFIQGLGCTGTHGRFQHSQYRQIHSLSAADAAHGRFVHSDGPPLGDGDLLFYETYGPSFPFLASPLAAYYN